MAKMTIEEVLNNKYLTDSSLAQQLVEGTLTLDDQIIKDHIHQTGAYAEIYGSNEVTTVNEPVADPVDEPAKEPEVDPTDEPTVDPVEEPEVEVPTEEPETDPTDEPTVDPTDEPAADPVEEPETDPTE